MRVLISLLLIVSIAQSHRFTPKNRPANEHLRSNRILTGEADNGNFTFPPDNIIHYDKEVHLSNVRQLTFGGENAEGYFSFDNTLLTLQATGYGTDCDQIYELDLTRSPREQTLRRISTGLGGTTCSYFYKEHGNNHRLYAGNWWNVNISNYADPSKTCPKKQCSPPYASTKLEQLCNASYTWDIFPDYDIFKVDRYGNIVQRLTDSPGYDAEGVLSPDGKTIVFTSIRTGDLELWSMDVATGTLTQLTFALGYDGGAFFSPDGKRLIFRASRPNTTEEIDKYKELLSYNLVEPVAMELFVMDLDTKEMRQITHLGGANWAPYYLNDNKHVIFSSNYFDAANGYGSFALFTISDDGDNSTLTRITYGLPFAFNAFAMMSYDGKQLVWGSSRNGTNTYELNLFMADWVDNPQQATTTHKPTGNNGDNNVASYSLSSLFALIIAYFL